MNQVLMMTSRREAWKFLVVLTLMNISSSVVYGFVFVVVVIDKAPSKAVDISTISLSFINGPASVFPSLSTTDLKNLSGHKLRVENANKTAKKRA